MKQAPYNEAKARAVPHSADEEHHQGIQHFSGFALSVSAKRNIDVITKEIAQGHMPFSPEFHGGFGENTGF